MGGYRLLLLDLDDTILDNKLADIESFRRVLKDYRIRPPASSEIMRWRKNGMLAGNIFKRAVRNDPELAQRCASSRLEFLRDDKNIVLLRPKPDAYSALKRISGSLKIAIVTARTGEGGVQEILRRCRLHEFVDRVLCEEDVGDGGYADYAGLKEGLYRLAIRKTGCKKTETVVVGNLKSDIVAGKRLGLKTYGIKGSYRYDSGLKGITDTFEDLESVAARLVQGKRAAF